MKINNTDNTKVDISAGSGIIVNRATNIIISVSWNDIDGEDMNISDSEQYMYKIINRINQRQDRLEFKVNQKLKENKLIPATKYLYKLIEVMKDKIINKYCTD